MTDLHHSLQKAYTEICQNLHKAHQCNKVRYGAKCVIIPYHVGDQVWLYVPSVKSKIMADNMASKVQSKRSTCPLPWGVICSSSCLVYSHNDDTSLLVKLHSTLVTVKYSWYSISANNFIK